MAINPDYELFKKEFPEPAKVFGELFQAVSSYALDEKTKQLVYLGILTANRYSPAVPVHIAMALKAGATPEEIKEAMMLAIPAGGLCNFLAVLPKILDELNKQ
ncbi:carboxymuconolactone decarboxylase family protein [Bacillus sp. 03113]|uniref:carboxymuconolactone decarboxylase family protein n=1 Tax=Bacillus sp. 03113 TaxID=2578211 RepID=UPI001143C227|nr:carboxymuconolactone decarboxylase family protein [Bacillus sp. 03113]